MTFLSGRHIPRRTFLRGAGASVALPFLDAMVPAGRGGSLLHSAGETTRLVCIEEVHGLAGCVQAVADRHLFAPATVGTDFTLDPTNVLNDLERWQPYMTIVSNSDVRMAEAFTTQEIGGDHFRSTAVFLTQAHPKQTQGSDIFAGTSLDQIHARRFGQGTALPSLQLCIENLDSAGGCWYNYHCAYTDSMSWASPTDPLPMIRDPRVAFDLLFGSGGTNEERAVRRRTNQSILDWVVGEVAYLKQQLGAVDRQRIDQYLEDVREIERRIQMVEAFNTSGEPRELPEAPPGVPDSFTEHMKLMMDLQVLALETDVTRVIAFKMGRDASNRIFPESGTNRSFHGASHHGGNTPRVLEFHQVNKYRTGLLGHLLEKLEKSMEGDASLLHKSVVLWGSPMADGNLHNHRRAPLVLFGKGNGILQGNVHLKAPDSMPMANAFLTLLHSLGHEDIETFGDSTGEFPLTSSRTVTAESSSSR
jgi:hypothetical protein